MVVFVLVVRHTFDLGRIYFSAVKYNTVFCKILGMEINLQQFGMCSEIFVFESTLFFGGVEEKTKELQGPDEFSFDGL